MTRSIQSIMTVNIALAMLLNIILDYFNVYESFELAVVSILFLILMFLIDIVKLLVLNGGSKNE